MARPAFMESDQRLDPRCMRPAGVWARGSTCGVQAGPQVCRPPAHSLASRAADALTKLDTAVPETTWHLRLPPGTGLPPDLVKRCQALTGLVTHEQLYKTLKKVEQAGKLPGSSALLRQLCLHPRGGWYTSRAHVWLGFAATCLGLEKGLAEALKAAKVGSLACLSEATAVLPWLASESCLTADLVALADVWRAFYSEQMELAKKWARPQCISLPCPLALLHCVADASGATSEGLTILADLPLCISVNIGILVGALHKALRALSRGRLVAVDHCEVVAPKAPEVTPATTPWFARQVDA